ncbi:hypothetical protein GGR52DRAFT_529026 [Hypoxylon sp. FL1284]|nr:hypothetical protein GGR52DRAFT_529026 [Hypoxylon sp. FL1284]
MAAEIGRQAKIFKGAAHAFVWCTRHSVTTLEAVHTRMEKYMQNAGNHSVVPEGGELEYLNRLDVIRPLTNDPWFSSLWTLQEAFLRQDAILLTLDGELWPNPEVKGPPDVASLVALLEPISDNVRYGEDVLSSDTQTLRELEKVLDDSGLIALMMQNPIALLSVAQHRKTGPDNTTDRVYGIMQVFDLQVGKSRPGVNQDRSFSLEELEDELGAEIMAMDPIMSQLFVHRHEPPVGKGWRMGPSSRIAYYISSDVYEEMRNPQNQRVSLTRLSTAFAKPVLWGHFSGPACPVKQVHTVWEKLDRLWWTPMSIALDYTVERRSRLGSDTMLEVMTKLIRDHGDAVVLHLGYCTQVIHGVRTPCHAVAIIMVPYQPTGQKGPARWKRVGICTWSLDWPRYRNKITNDMKEFMLGKGGQWKMSEGLFG